MIRRTTWVILAVFVALLGVLFYFQRNPLGDSDEEATPTAIVELISLDQDQIEKLQLSDSQGNEIAFVKSDDGGWMLADPLAALASDAVVQSILHQLDSLSSLSKLESQVPEETLGLNPTQYEIKASTGDGSKQTIYIGIQTPTGSGYYLRVDDGPIYVVSKFSVDTMLTPFTDTTSFATVTPEAIQTEPGDSLQEETPVSTP